MKKVLLFLDYAAPHPDAIGTFHTSDMILAVDSNASYLSESGARSCAGGYFPLSNNSANLPNNGGVLTVSQIIKAIMSSTAKAKIGALYINCRAAIPAQHTLTKMGHPQTPTPIQTNNITALGVVNNTMAPKRANAMGMRFYWLHA